MTVVGEHALVQLVKTIGALRDREERRQNKLRSGTTDK